MPTAIIVALIAGVFTIAATLIGALLKTGPERPEGEVSNNKKSCEITIDNLNLALQVNGNLSSVRENETIEASKGDSLLLTDLGMDLSHNDACADTTIAAVAYLRKPKVRNENLKDKYDYQDGRFTNGARVRRAFQSGDFFSKSGNPAWVLEEDWNNLVLTLVEYSSQYPDGTVIERFHFRLAR